MHNIYNALAAVAVGLDRGLTLSEAAERAGDSCSGGQAGSRSSSWATSRVINDCYNSNPTALTLWSTRWPPCRLSDKSWWQAKCWNLAPGARRCIGVGRNLYGRERVDLLVGVRGLAKPMVEAARQAGMQAEFVATPEEAGEWLAREAREGDVVLLKASRGVKLERALEALVNHQPSVVRKSKTTGN